MNLPDFIASDTATLALIVRAKLVNDLANTSYDDAWDALLAEGKEYAPPKEVEDWMRENWQSAAFGAEPQGELAENTPNYPISHARAWMAPFLDKFVETGGNATKAAFFAGVHERTPYKAREVDKDFAEAWEWAERKVADVIREEMKRRGVDGWDEPVYGTLGGKFAGEGLVGAIRKFDSSILIKMATARVPEYRSLVKEGAAQVSATATASAKSESKAVVSVEEMKERQTRQRKKLAHQVDRARERGLTLGTGNTN